MHNQSKLGDKSKTIRITLSVWFIVKTTSEQRELKDPAKDPQYSEPQIDVMRAQKDQVKCVVTT